MQDQIVKYLKMTLPILRKYAVMFILTAVAMVTLIAINNISKASGVDRNESYYNKLEADVNVIKFDTTAIEAIKALEDSDASIGSQFPDDRNNPF